MIKTKLTEEYFYLDVYD